MLCDNLKFLRRKCGLSQREFAAQLGVSASAVGMYEQGRREPEPRLLLRMSELLGVSVDRLLSDAQAVELDALVEDVVRRIHNEEVVTLGGKALDEKALQTLTDAIRMGVAFAQRTIQTEQEQVNT